MPRVIGLCGGSGSGKGVVGSFFTKHGYLTIDTDKVYREITDNTSHCLDALVCEFGAEILNSEGKLNRQRLGQMVFSDKEKLNTLNAITHKFILERVRSIINDSENNSYIGFVVDAPLLYESGFDKECDVVVAVVCDVGTRVARIVARDGISSTAALKRINSQTSDNQISALADFTIENNGDTKKLEHDVTEIIRKINLGDYRLCQTNHSDKK